MIICKNLNPANPINTLSEWGSECPPQGKSKQWKDGRSAKETAKQWLQTIPVEFCEILKSFKLNYEYCSPEHVSKLDNFKGNARNHDLLITATDPNGEKFVISVESKVDEPFDVTVEERREAAMASLIKNPRSKAQARVNNLLDAIFVKPDFKHEALRYQLLTAIAGTLAEAKKQEAKKAIFLVQTFISNNMKSKLHRQNQLDFDYLIKLLTNGNQEIIHDGDLVGPFTFPGNDFIPGDVELWVGKYAIKL